MTSSNNEKDPLALAMEEAESLMASLGGGDDDNNNAYTIDSDDEDDDIVKLMISEEKPIPSTPADNNNSNIIISGENNDNNNADLHPLHDNFLMTPNNSTSNAAPTNLSNTISAATTSSTTPVQPPPNSNTGAGSGGFMNSATAGMYNMMMMGTSSGGSGGGTPPSANSATTAPLLFSSGGSNISQQQQQQQQHASMDALKASTSRFASNLANMAQRAANQVTGSGSTTTSAMNNNNNSISGTGTSPSTFSIMMNNPLQSHVIGSTTTPQQQQQTLAATTTNVVGSNTTSTTIPELDEEQKKLLLSTHVGDLLKGERVIMFLSNLLHVSDSTGLNVNSNNWCCVMTFYRIILFPTHTTLYPNIPSNWAKSCWPENTTNSSNNTIVQMPLSSIEKVEKNVFNIGTNSVLGLICTSKLNYYQIRFSTSIYADTNRAYDALQNYAFPGRRNLGYLFAFESKREIVMASIQVDEATGNKQVTLPPIPQRFNPTLEYQRQFQNAGFAQQQQDTTNDTTTTTNNENNIENPWSLYMNINASYQLCSSYPSVLVGPASLQQNSEVRIIRQCASFRSEQRLPSLTWCGPDGASIWRCSQPKVGLQGNRSSADEQFFKHIQEGAAHCRMNSIGGNKQRNHNEIPPVEILQRLTGSNDLSNWMPDVSLKILDLRPRSSAMANRTGGYGYENTSNYPNCSLQFCGIGNIHAVRDSYQKLSQVCLSVTTNDLQFISAVEDTKWLNHIRLIWAAAWETAYWVHVHKLPVVIHCSHGWDRTSQVAVLAQIILDPYYRTLKGFACLIEKDFMSFGHPFHTRCGHGQGTANNNINTNSNTVNSSNHPALDEGQISPIFLQFLDCVYQIVNLYPESFEYNTKYLLCLSKHIYSCRFGNFLCDSERERELVAGVRQRTNSIWDYLESSIMYKNKNYILESGVLLMPLPTLLRNITLWKDRHCMYGGKSTIRMSLSVSSEDDEKDTMMTTEDILKQIYCTKTNESSNLTTTLIQGENEESKSPAFETTTAVNEKN